MRDDLIRERPDVVKGWLEAELDVERYLADPKNATAVVQMAKAQTTGFDDKALWLALFGSYPPSVGGSPQRLSIPFGFSSPAQDLLKRQPPFFTRSRASTSPS
jgi:NitT/TauT family transport system substrate-binding protein